MFWSQHDAYRAFYADDCGCYGCHERRRLDRESIAGTAMDTAYMTRQREQLAAWLRDVATPEERRADRELLAAARTGRLPSGGIR